MTTTTQKPEIGQSVVANGIRTSYLGAGSGSGTVVLSTDRAQGWGWRIPFLLSVFVVIAGYIVRRKVDETPAFPRLPVHAHGRAAAGSDHPGHQGELAGHASRHRMSLMNTIAVTTTVFGRAFATQPSYGVGMSTTTYRGSAPVTLWIPVLGNFVPVLVIPFVGNLSDKVGRKTVFIVGALSSGATSFLYLYSIGQGNVIMTVVMAIIMWGILTRAATRSSPRSTWNCSRPGRVSPRSPSPRTSVRR